MTTWTEEVGNSVTKGPTSLTPTEPPRAFFSDPMAGYDSMRTSPRATPRDLPTLDNTSEPALTPREISGNFVDGPEVLRPAVLTPKQPTRRLPLHLKSEESTLSFQPTHRRARTDLFSSSRNTFIRPDALEDVRLSTDEQAPKLKSDHGNKLFAGLFQGESAPIRLGIVPSPSKEKDPTSGGSSPTTQSRPSSPTKKMAVTSSLKNIAYSNPFSIFSAKPQQEQLSNMPEPANDEFLNLDINATLFRAEMSDLPPEEALFNFQRNAENLVRRLQSAYKLRTFALHQALAEKVEQKEELEETQSRLQNMKSQLDGMAAKALEQDKEMKALAEELKLERQKRQQEDEARRRSIMIVKKPDDFPDAAGTQTSPARRHTKNSSGASVSGDSGFESADESISESVFSKRTDDTVPTRPASVISPTLDAVPCASMISTPSTYQPWPSKSKITPPSRSSTYDKVLKGISAAGSSLSNFTASKCPNCHGAKVSDPGHVTTILQAENRVLKTRITELETAVEDCITLVGG
ncbi:hypothetical protein PRK78_002081 [Emydomyces testavorans]|uniref:Uncharacterized protein n=1 Tax=Emydomyces testavorans TaxID=2070801 RepID=A0AAF0DE99_9EURO|nr:hypothetical protein PRK78_002081 [Emydomyces testavorans]